MVSTMLLLLRLAMMPSMAQQPVPAPSQDVTYLDMSEPEAPESDLPAIVKKGPL